MTQLTSRFQLPAPDGGGANNYPLHMKQLADRIAALMLGWSSGKLNQRDPAGAEGRIFAVKGDDTATNNGRLFYDNGTVWEELSVSRPLRFSGTLDGSGVGMVAHGLGSGVATKLQTVQAWSKGNAGEALPLTVTYVDGNNVRVTGGTANR